MRWVESSGEPRSVSGKLVVSGLLQDITERKRAEIALRESKERLNFALDAATAGPWELALATGKLPASDRTLSFVGLPPGAELTYDLALGRIHPDDHAPIDTALRRTVETGQP